MKFLNLDKVLCLSAHPDDIEYGVLGSMIKFKDTQFDILVLTDIQFNNSDNSCLLEKFSIKNIKSLLISIIDLFLST